LPVHPADRADYPVLLALTRARCDPEALARAWAEGQSLTLEDAWAYATGEPLSP
jgi:hypothetical protein